MIRQGALVRTTPWRRRRLPGQHVQKRRQTAVRQRRLRQLRHTRLKVSSHIRLLSEAFCHQCSHRHHCHSEVCNYVFWSVAVGTNGSDFFQFRPNYVHQRSTIINRIITTIIIITGLSSKSANLHQRQNFNQKWCGIRIRIAGLSRIRIRIGMSAGSLPKCCGFITLLASVISLSLVKIGWWQCRHCSIQMPKQFCRGLQRVSFLRQLIWDAFYDPPRI